MERSEGDDLESRPLEAYELRRMLELGESIGVLDVRSTDDYRDSDAEIVGASRLRPEGWEAHVRELPRDRLLVLYGRDEGDSVPAQLADALRRKGFGEVRFVKGGFEAYLNVGGPVSPRSRER
jgi:rhodanese-related sulfurtransferase